MSDRNQAAAADNSVADNLSGEEMSWEGINDDADFGQALTDQEISVEGQEVDSQTEQPEGEGDTEQSREEPAGQQAPRKPAAPAGNQQQTPPPPVQPQAPSSEQRPTQQREPLFHELVNTNFDAAVDHVVGQGLFRLAPEEAELFEPEAVKLMEKQSARIFLRNMAAMSATLHNTLPQVVGNLIGVNTQARTYEDQFYSDHGFDKAKHHDTLVTIARNVLALNPGIDRTSLMNQVAQHGHAILGTKAPVKGAKPTAQTPQGAAVVKRQPFAPAGRAAGGAPVQRKSPGQKAAPVNPIFDLNAMLSQGVDMDD